MSDCNVDEIMKQLKVLDSLRQLRDNMGEGVFMESFPELTNITGKLDAVIEHTEEELNARMAECGKIEMDELTTEAMPEEPAAPELIESFEASLKNDM